MPGGWEAQVFASPRQSVSLASVTTQKQGQPTCLRRLILQLLVVVSLYVIRIAHHQPALADWQPLLVVRVRRLWFLHLLGRGFGCAMLPSKSSLAHQGLVCQMEPHTQKMGNLDEVGADLKYHRKKAEVSTKEKHLAAGL